MAIRLKLNSVFMRQHVCANNVFSRCMSSVAAETSPVDPIKTKETIVKKKRDVIMKEFYPEMNALDAVPKVKSLCWTKFDETIELALKMGLDPRKPNQSVKGVAKLPFGTGKANRVCVFATGAEAQAALAAGAEKVGSDDLIDLIRTGEFKYDTVIATPDMMGMISKVGKILGPRGLMPNPKMGTVTRDVAQAVRAAKTGAVRYKVDKHGYIQAGIGKQSFSTEALIENIRAFMLSIADAKPEGLKGKYLMKVTMSSTMGPGIKIELPSIDPANAKFLLKIAPKVKK